MILSEVMRTVPHAPPNHWADWREQAACAGLTWMAEHGKTQQARKVCRSCPVLAQCRAWVLDPDTGMVAGVVAGLTPSQRGLIECACGAMVPKAKSRNGRCWSCYRAA